MISAPGGAPLEGAAPAGLCRGRRRRPSLLHARQVRYPAAARVCGRAGDAARLPGGPRGPRARQEAAAPPRRSPAAAAPAARPRFWSGTLRVGAVFEETPDVRTFRLVREDAGPLPFEHAPGQYLNLALMIDGKRVNRSYTIASSPTRGHACEITVKRSADGYGSAHLHDRITVGSTLKVSAPAGRFVFTGAEADRRRPDRRRRGDHPAHVDRALPDRSLLAGADPPGGVGAPARRADLRGRARLPAAALPQPARLLDADPRAEPGRGQ